MNFKEIIMCCALSHSSFNFPIYLVYTRDYPVGNEHRLKQILILLLI